MIKGIMSRDILNIFYLPCRNIKNIFYVPKTRYLKAFKGIYCKYGQFLSVIFCYNEVNKNFVKLIYRHNMDIYRRYGGLIDCIIDKIIFKPLTNTFRCVILIIEGISICIG